MIGFTQIYRFDVEIIISTLFAQESHRFSCAAFSASRQGVSSCNLFSWNLKHFWSKLRFASVDQPWHRLIDMPCRQKALAL